MAWVLTPRAPGQYRRGKAGHRGAEGGEQREVLRDVSAEHPDGGNSWEKSLTVRPTNSEFEVLRTGPSTKHSVATLRSLVFLPSRYFPDRSSASSGSDPLPGCQSFGKLRHSARQERKTINPDL